MPSTTTREQFIDRASRMRVVPVVREIFADSETPVGLYRKLADGTPGSFLLESAEGGIWSRYSFVGVSSYGVLTQSGDTAQWLDYGLSAERAVGDLDDLAPLEAVGELTRRWSGESIPELPPLTGGLVGFLGWESVRQIERLPNAPVAEHPIPGQAMCFVSDLVVLDHRRGTVQLIANVLADSTALDDLWNDAQTRLTDMQTTIARPSDAQLADVDFAVEPEPRHRTPKEDFLAAVEKSKSYIREGDIFQVVLSQRFEMDSDARPIDVYRMLRTLNPSPYMYLLSLETPTGTPYAIVGSSPEALVKSQGGHVVTHPIAGSQPRGSTPDEDAAFERTLRSDDKERAEHLMLVDLARNDLAKVCVPGTVDVTEFMRVERFSHIMHLVSSVEGKLRPEMTPIDIFRATFPAGTLSGAPKPRALQIIDELEPAQRGVYGGVVGYIGFSGETDLAIAIRTATLMNGTAIVQAGGGLVADSVAESEYQESCNKAAAPLRAVAIADAMVRIGER
ncbi:anthranilate synthase component I [Paramicrobacterium fandaimingii]|uniref:anthranilate synthase component I n=1 Tax=Paramicrobacterium fandaimingii TaxID=2708079 RepID=UPI00141FA753|nr:anthranilate synthase component I [Microbacterium fandaimingii]